MDVVRQALQEMGYSMSIVVQQIYNVTDLCNDGQLRKLSSQGVRASHESAGPRIVAVDDTVNQPSAERSVAVLIHICKIVNDAQAGLVWYVYPMGKTSWVKLGKK